MTIIFECSWKNGTQRSEHETIDGAKSKARRLSKDGGPVLVFEYDGETVNRAWGFEGGKAAATYAQAEAQTLDADREPLSQVDEETGTDAGAPAAEAAPVAKGKGKAKKAPKAPVAAESQPVATGVAGEVLSAFKARSGTNRAKLLARMADDLGKPVTFSDLAVAVYGDNEKRAGMLSMVMKGAQYSIGKDDLPFTITKEKAEGVISYRLDRAA